MLSKNRIKFVKSLHHKKYRDENELFISEGEKIVKELLSFFPNTIEFIYCTKEFEQNLIGSNLERCEIISESELKQISCLQKPNKAFALCKMWKLESPKKVDFHLALDDIQDPGNMGTIIRLADWFGVKSIVCSTNSVDIFNPKVIQASMGSVFRMNFFYTDLDDFFVNSNLQIYGTFLQGESIYNKTLSPNGILVLGNEGKGISAELEKRIHEKITIPRFGNAESLNVSVATGIILSEFFRNYQ
jgi:TrmH family RNA methyltransferase